MGEKTLFDSNFYKVKKLKYEKNYNDTLKMYLSGSWFKCFGTDALIINDFFKLKIYDEDNFTTRNLMTSNIFCGFPTYMLGKICNKLKKEKINYLVVILSTDEQDYIVYKDNFEMNRYQEVLKNIEYKNSPRRKIENIMNNLEMPLEETNVIAKNNNKSNGEKRVVKGIKDNIVEVGDKVKIQNICSRKIEIFTIVPTYKKEEPKRVITLKSGYRYIKYKTEIISDNDVEKGEIISESPFAKALLGSRKKQIIEFKDMDGKKERYYILDIIKKNMI